MLVFLCGKVVLFFPFSVFRNSIVISNRIHTHLFQTCTTMSSRRSQYGGSTTPSSASRRSPRSHSRIGSASSTSKRASGRLANIYFNNKNKKDNEDSPPRRPGSSRRRQRSPRRNGQTPSRSSGGARSVRSGARSNAGGSTRSSRSGRRGSGEVVQSNSRSNRRSSSRGRAKNLWDRSNTPSNRNNNERRDINFDVVDDLPPRQSLSSQANGTDMAGGGWSLNLNDQHLNRQAIDRHTLMMAQNYTGGLEDDDDNGGRGRNERLQRTPSSSRRSRPRSHSNTSPSSGGSEGRGRADSQSSMHSFLLDDGNTSTYSGRSHRSVANRIHGTKEDDDDNQDVFGHGRWVTVYGFNVRKHADAVLNYFSKADWSDMVDFFNRILQRQAGNLITSDSANDSDMTKFLGSARNDGK